MNEVERKQIADDVLSLLKGDADLESVLGYMREKGLSQTDSFLTLMKTTGIDMEEAQKRVFNSRTWADRLEANIKLQQDAMQAWRELAEESDPSFKIDVELLDDPEKSES
jgi:hypothetical protein